MKRTKLWVLGLLAMALTACTTPDESGKITTTPETVTVHNSGGGTIVAFVKERKALVASGKRVVITGYCASACTMFYSMPNACMAKGSSLHFHGASGPIAVSETVGNATMAKYYRAGIKAKFQSDWKHLTKPMHKLTRAEAKALDPDIKFCEDVK